MEDHSTKKAQIIQLNESAVRDHLGEMVRNTVEDTLNNMLDSEADRLCNAEKYQRHDARTDTRAGHYQRKLHTKAGEGKFAGVRLPRCQFRDLTYQLGSLTPPFPQGIR